MHATNPTLHRRPLRDVTPAKFAHQDSTIVIDWDPQTPNDLFQTRYELLKATIRQVIFRGGLESYWETNPKTGVRKPSTLLNDLIENATSEGLYLLRPQITASELLHSDMSDEVIQLTRYPLSDAELVRQAKCIADKVVKSQKIIKRPYKRDEAGNLVLRDGKPVRGYKCVGLRTEHPVRNRDINDNPVQGWSSPVDNFISGIDGRPINGGQTTNYAYATDAMVNEIQRRTLREVLSEYLGRDDAEWLLDYTDGRYPKSAEGDEMAEALTEKLKPYSAELEKFRSLLT